MVSHKVQIIIIFLLKKKNTSYKRKSPKWVCCENEFNNNCCLHPFSQRGGKKVLFKKILPTVFDMTRFSIFKSKVLPIILVSNACVFFKLPIQPIPLIRARSFALCEESWVWKSKVYITTVANFLIEELHLFPGRQKCFAKATGVLEMHTWCPLASVLLWQLWVTPSVFVTPSPLQFRHS